MKSRPWAVKLVLVIAAMALAALNVPGARAQSSTPREETWITNGAVRAVVRTTDTVYIGGWFTYVGPATGGGGQTRNHIAAIDAATGAATDWNPNANNTVYALAVSGSTVYAGGDFTSIGGQMRNNIAALDASTGAATDWNPNANSEVRVLTVSDSTVYAGGIFNSIGGQKRNYIAALDAATTGAATDWNPNADNPVFALAVSGSTVFAGGFFDSIGGQTRNCIAALDAATGAATTWNPDAAGGHYLGINALAVSGLTVYAGGGFWSIGGQTRNNIAALNAATGAATAWDPNAFGEVDALAVSGSTVYAGGDFTSIGGQTRNRIAALDAATGAATDWNPSAEGSYYYVYVYALAVSGSTVYAGGDFTSIGGDNTRCGFAQFDALPPERIKRYLLGLDSDPTGLDLNGDGKVDIADLIWYLSGKRLTK